MPFARDIDDGDGGGGGDGDDSAMLLLEDVASLGTSPKPKHGLGENDDISLMSFDIHFTRLVNASW